MFIQLSAMQPTTRLRSPDMQREAGKRFPIATLGAVPAYRRYRRLSLGIAGSAAGQRTVWSGIRFDWLDRGSGLQAALG